MSKKVSLREYARIRGVHLNAVQTAIKSGRIHALPNGQIDVEEANKEWFVNTDPALQRKVDPLFESQIEATSQNKNNFSTFQQAKTADIYYRAMIAKAKLKVLTGEVVDKKKAGDYAYRLGRDLRDLVLSFSVRYGAIIASELGTDEHKTTMILEKYVRELLSNSEELLDRHL